MADVIPFQLIYYSLRIKSFHKTRRKHILHTINKTIFVTLSVYPCFKSFWRINISGCVIGVSLARQYLWHCPCIYVSTPFGDLWSKHYRLCDSKLAEGSLRLSTHTKNKPWVDYEPRSAHGRADKNNKDKGRVDYELRLAHGRAVKKHG